jgi:hypothetical protein
MKLKRKEFTDLKQGGMTVNEYLNSFIQLSRYAPDDINTDEKKQDVFLNGLNDDIQFQLLNTDYADYQHMVDKATVVENKIREMEKDGKSKVPFSGHSSESNVRPRFLQPNQFFKPPDESHADADANAAPPISDATAAVPDAEAKCSAVANITAAEPPGRTDTAPTEPATDTPPLSATFS